jgi:hypothetical protein
MIISKEKNYFVKGFGMTCEFCDTQIDDPEFIEIYTRTGGDSFHLHRNCVIAFATRIQNEFEKL